MEQETTDNYPSRTEKVYKDREIWVATLLGGTLAAGYMVARNFQALGETGKVRKTWAVTFAATVIIFLIGFYAPYLERFPGFLFPLVIAGIVVVLAQMYQGERVRRHISAGGQIQSWWKTLGVSLAGMCATIVLFTGMAVIVTVIEETNTMTKNYGKMQHEVSYDKRNISESEVDLLADAATKSNLFLENRGKWYAYTRKVGTDYEISVSVNRATLNDKESLKFYNEVRGYMQAYFRNNKIILNLVEDDFSNVEKRIE